MRHLINNQGIALLVTIAVIAILIPTALELNKRMRDSVTSTAITRDRLVLSHMASSGIHAAMALLIKDKNDSDSDSLHEDWNDPDIINELIVSIPFEQGKISINIIDELSKIQVNALVEFPEGHKFNQSQYIMWNRFLSCVLSQYDIYDESKTTNTIINSVKDWLDSGDEDAVTGLSGAESEYYQDLEPPYACRNGPFTHLGELVLVKGITKDIFYSAGGAHGISRYMTIFGADTENIQGFTFPGKININTAELPVLAALLPEEHEQLATAIYEYREETSDGKYIHPLSNLNRYRDAPGCGNITINQKAITITSNLFRIESTALLHEIKMDITAIVQRKKNKLTGKWCCNVLSWQIE